MIKRLMAVVLSAAFIASAGAAEKDSLALTQQKKNKFHITTRKKLKKQNSDLKYELDSIRAELERYRIELSIADSINYEMMAIYRGNEDSHGT